MPKQKTDDLLQLVASLTRAEKRHFRLFVKRNQSSNDILFLQLFDYLDKHQLYDEPMILKKIPEIKKTQLSNLKAHLYKQLLISLRLLSKKNNEDIQIREMIDYGRVLYDKGLYRQALDVLHKVKQRSKTYRFDSLTYEIVAFEKMIEEQYITRSIEGRAGELAEESMQLNNKMYRSSQFSNLSLQMYALYLKIGHVKSEEDFFYIKDYFQERLPNVAYESLDFWAKVFYNKAHFWYYHMTQDFPFCFRYAQRWVALFTEDKIALQTHTPTYLKGLHNLMNSLFNLVQYDRFMEVLAQLEDFPSQFNLKRNRNIEGLYHFYWYMHQIKRHFLEGSFTEGVLLIPELEKIIQEDRYNWDERRILVFYYRIALMYFGSGDNDKTIDYLNLIINQKNPDYREDIQIFARILNLIAHFELNNKQLIEYQVKSVYRFLAKMEDLHEVQKEIYQFIKKMPRMREDELKDEFVSLKARFEILENRQFTRRPFLYLDIISWLESKIENIPVQEVIRAKFLKRKRD